MSAGEPGDAAGGIASRVPRGSPSAPAERGPDPRGWRLGVLALAAIGVVFGDIGTSPLYAFRACLTPPLGIRGDPRFVYGVLSLIVWSLILVVAVKYVAVVMRLDNRGEGGILALLALRLQRQPRGFLVGLGLFGAALLYGDGVITPAISVLSAVEGLEVATPQLAYVVVPATLLILLALFSCQRFGTAWVGGVFAPIMVTWFAVIGALGALEITRAPAILLALNPWYGVQVFTRHGIAGFLVLGAVVLAITGAEALYADMGHFGRRPIRIAWFAVVLPALLLNYFGQGALVLRRPEAIDRPFFLMAPRPFLYPLLALATLATVVASQALISGAFSLTHQCIQLRYSPRMSIVHTSRSQAGQIYIPEVNTALMVGCLLLVLGFGSSAALGAAYGISVTGTMAITTVLFGVLARQRWRWPLRWVAALAGGFLVIDLAFFAANATKIREGGWVPLAIAGGLFLLMTTWSRGTQLLGHWVAGVMVPLDKFLAEVDQLKPPRVPGTAVFMTAYLDGAPLVLQRQLRYNKALHEELILLAILTEQVPEVDDAERLKVEALRHGLYRVSAHFGFMERPDVREILSRCRLAGMRADEDDTVYYLWRMRLLPTGSMPMARWRKRLFGLMARNASSAADFFNLPTDRVIELGALVDF
ncbi:MAG TPA: potassium transporter Kup [Candidatus Methylomirabilis sp.]|nr:potassium transporter Kup [Candidatus Methylomirabilis sp.]